MDGQCLHGMEPSWCGHCNGRAGEPPHAELPIIATFTASYPGRCINCDRHFGAGAHIGRTTDNTYVCGRCLP